MRRVSCFDTFTKLNIRRLVSKFYKISFFQLAILDKSDAKY